MELLTRDYINQLKSSRELDALISENVFNKSCLGYTICSNYDGFWSVDGDYIYEEDEVNSGYEKHPVRLSSMVPCQCESINNMNKDDGFCTSYKCFDHYTHCLEVIPFYSTDISDAWKIIEHLTKPLDEILDLETGDRKYGYWMLDRLGYNCCQDGKPDVDGAHGQWRCFMSCNIDDENRYDEFSTADSAPLAICKTALFVSLKNKNDCKNT